MIHLLLTLLLGSGVPADATPKAWSGTVVYRVEPVFVPSNLAHHVPDSVRLETDGRRFRIEEAFASDTRVWMLAGDGTAQVYFRFVGVPVALNEPCEATGRVLKSDAALGAAPCVWPGEALPVELEWGDGIVYRLVAERVQPGRISADRFSPLPGYQTVDKASLETLLLTLPARN